jgi:two-component system heavy metal sensor histidine kinase CusS
MVGAVAAALVGGWVLVGVALFPLKRLSFAVSQITHKDFNLPIDPRTLPAEVNPVAGRLSQSLVQLQAAFEREKRAAADISHELRTPLAALTTTIEVACRKTRTAEQYRQTLDECRGIARQMSQLVERMLMLAWLDAGADQVRPERVEVGELVGGVAAIGKPLAEVQGLSLRVNLAGPLTVRTDPDKLREVVMNLLHNAIEYNRPGGEVELTAAATPQGGVMVEVRDTGIGMSPEVQAKIFERFFRADPSRQATGVHAGLGLAIVKEYVDRLGGRLTVDSAVGRGSRFRVELPNAL